MSFEMNAMKNVPNSILYPQHLAQFLTHSTRKLNIRWTEVTSDLSKGSWILFIQKQTASYYLFNFLKAQLCSYYTSNKHHKSYHLSKVYCVSGYSQCHCTKLFPFLLMMTFMYSEMRTQVELAQLSRCQGAGLCLNAHLSVISTRLLASLSKN